MKSNYKPLIVAVFLVFAGFIAREWSLSQAASPTKIVGVSDVSATNPAQALIGVAQAQGLEMADSAIVTEADAPSGELDANQPPTLSIDEPAYADAAVEDPGQPIGQAVDPTQTSKYTVKKGDTLSSIANQFDVSVASILSANPNMSKKSVKIGAVITIPATAPSAAATNSPALPNYNGDFIMPAPGYDAGVLDANNGVNIVNSCGTPVIAAADGVVVPDQSVSVTAGGWNDGYGNFILIEEPFGNEIYTRYSHLQQSLVSIGDYVKQGQQIGLIGQTGGASVCELNFQVIGAQNPFAK